MTDVTLKEHLEAQIRWLDRYFMDQVKSIEAKTELAKADIDTRLQGMNEFRDALRDQASRLATRQELDLHVSSMDKRIKSIEISRATADGKTIMLSGFIAFIASILVAVIANWK
jgi:hypothetical protein